MSMKWFLPALLLAAAPAAAHDWYPIECCHGMDCAPVLTAVMDSESNALVVTTRHGTVPVPAAFPRRESKDHRMHVCMRPGSGGMRLICIFLPPAT